MQFPKRMFRNNFRFGITIIINYIWFQHNSLRGATGIGVNKLRLLFGSIGHIEHLLCAHSAVK